MEAGDVNDGCGASWGCDLARCRTVWGDLRSVVGAEVCCDDGVRTKANTDGLVYEIFETEKEAEKKQEKSRKISEHAT